MYSIYYIHFWIILGFFWIPWNHLFYSREKILCVFHNMTKLHRKKKDLKIRFLEYGAVVNTRRSVLTYIYIIYNNKSTDRRVFTTLPYSRNQYYKMIFAPPFYVIIVIIVIYVLLFLHFNLIFSPQFLTFSYFIFHFFKSAGF